MNDPHSIECECGARTPVINLAKEGESPIIIAGGALIHDRVCQSIEPEFNGKIGCQWCGKHWPKNVKTALNAGVEKK